MPPLPSDSSSPDASARAWLEAMVTRIEDDPELLASLTDEEVDAALAEEGIRASGVRASVRRRVREAETMPARSPARRTRFNPFMATALAFVGVVALASLWWIQQPKPLRIDDVQRYESALAELVRPSTKAPEPTFDDLVSEGAQHLLTAIRDRDTSAPAYLASKDFVEAYALASSTDERDTAAFFAGVATGLGGGTDRAVDWLRKVSANGAYGEAAQEAIDTIGG